MAVSHFPSALGCEVAAYTCIVLTCWIAQNGPSGNFPGQEAFRDGLRHVFIVFVHWFWKVLGSDLASSWPSEFPGPALELHLNWKQTRNCLMCCISRNSYLFYRYSDYSVCTHVCLPAYICGDGCFSVHVGIGFSRFFRAYMPHLNQEIVFREHTCGCLCLYMCNWTCVVREYLDATGMHKCMPLHMCMLPHMNLEMCMCASCQCERVCACACQASEWAHSHWFNHDSASKTFPVH